MVNYNSFWDHVDQQKLEGKPNFETYLKENLPVEYGIFPGVRDWNIFGEKIEAKYNTVGIHKPHSKQFAGFADWWLLRESVKTVLDWVEKNIFSALATTDRLTHHVLLIKARSMIEQLGVSECDKSEMVTQMLACYSARAAVCDSYFWDIIEELPF